LEDIRVENIEKEPTDSVFINIKEEKKKKQRKLTKTGKIVFGSLIFIAILFIGAFVYLKSDISNVKSIKVEGNTYLSDDYVVSLSEITEESKYLFLFTSVKESKMKKSDLIEDVSIKLGKNNSVLITVNENKVLGYKVSNNTSLILEDGTVIEFKAEYIKNLALLPLFVEVKEENIAGIAESLSEINDEVLMRISEVTNIAFTYDYNMVKLTMDDGHYVYSSIKGLRYLNSYLELLINQKNSKNKCFLILDEYHSAVNSNCTEIEGYMVNQTSTNE